MSNLLPLSRLALNHAKPGPAGSLPVLAYLPLASLRIDDRYQRRIEGRGLRVITRICGEFDWNKFAPLIVARVPGGELFAIIDGPPGAGKMFKCMDTEANWIGFHAARVVWQLMCRSHNASKGKRGDEK